MSYIYHYIDIKSMSIVPEFKEDYIIKELARVELRSFPSKIDEILEFMTESRLRNKCVIVKYYLYPVDCESHVRKTGVFNWFIKCISVKTETGKTWYVYDFANISIYTYPYMLFVMYNANNGTASLFELMDVDEDIYIDDRIYIDMRNLV